MTVSFSWPTESKWVAKLKTAHIQLNYEYGLGHPSRMFGFLSPYINLMIIKIKGKIKSCVFFWWEGFLVYWFVRLQWVEEAFFACFLQRAALSQECDATKIGREKKPHTNAATTASPSAAVAHGKHPVVAKVSFNRIKANFTSWNQFAQIP